MGRYVAKRVLQAIPLMILISLILFLVAQNIGDPIATMGGRNPVRSADRVRLQRQLGLDQPIYLQYVYWLVGNDWTKVDVDGNGIKETPGHRKGILRGDFGTSIIKRGVPVTKLIWQRIPNTLILMIPAEIIIILFGITIGTISAFRQYSPLDNTITAVSFIGLSMPVFFIAMILIYFFSVLFQRWGLGLRFTVRSFRQGSIVRIQHRIMDIGYLEVNLPCIIDDLFNLDPCFTERRGKK